MPRDSPTSRRSAGALLVAVTAAALLMFASPADAHTDIDYTLPADQEQAAEPVSEITVAFSAPVTLVGAGFEVFTPQEVIVQPGVVTEDSMVFVLQLDAPLAGGAVGVRYEVAAADGHVLEGSFSFTVPAPPATTSPAPTSTPGSPAPTTALPPVATGAAPTSSTEPAVVAPAPTTAPAGSIVPVDAVADDDGDEDGGDDGGSSTGLIIGLAVAIGAATAAFVVVRARAARAT